MKRDTQTQKRDTLEQQTDFVREKSVELGNGDPGRTAGTSEIDKQINATDRDTAGVSAPLQVNGLGKRTGHAKPQKTSSLSKHMKPEHKRMSRVMGYCLTLGTAETWSDFSFLAAQCLSDSERAALAFAALNSLELDRAEITAAASIGLAGAPLPPFLGGMDEARFWASCASHSERKAYALASFEAMSAKDQAAFFRHISEMEVAA